MSTIQVIHNGIMNKIDDLNHSDVLAPVKWVGLSGLNLAAAVNGVAFTAFETLNLAWQLPVALVRDTVLRAVHWLREEEPAKDADTNINVKANKHKKDLYEKLPGFADCGNTIARIGKQLAGGVTSLGGVLVIGSKYNVNKKYEFGNCVIDRLVAERMFEDFMKDHKMEVDRTSEMDINLDPAKAEGIYNEFMVEPQKE